MYFTFLTRVFAIWDLGKLLCYKHFTNYDIEDNRNGFGMFTFCLIKKLGNVKFGNGEIK